MKPLRKIRIASYLLLIASAISLKLSPTLVDQLISRLGPEQLGISEHYELVPDSIGDGSGFVVTDGQTETKVQLCGIDLSAEDPAIGIAARDHLRDLASRGDGQLTLVKVETTQDDRTIVEVFVPTGNGDEELHLNSQMVADGMASLHAQSIERCPNAEPMRIAERAAKEAAKGVWANPVSQKL